MRPSMVFTLAATVIGGLVLSGCGASTSKVEPQIRVQSCGIELSLAEPAKRAVATEQSATDTLLALGVAQQMVGTGNQKGAPKPEYQADYQSIPVLSKKVITAEQLRNANPDLVVAPFASHYTNNNLGTREELAKLGVAPFLFATDCRDLPENQGKDSLTLIAEDVVKLGKLFGKSERAEQIATEFKAKAEKVNRKDSELVKADLDVVWIYSIFKGAPYVGGGVGVPQSISQLAGVKNVFSDTKDAWPEVSWEAIADRDPDLIVLADLSSRGAPGDPANDKIAQMKADPAMAKLSAVQAGRFVIMDAAEMSEGVRSVDGLVIFDKYLKENGYLKK